MKIYTKRGDTGFTDIIGGIRLTKDNARVEAYGSVDELNSHVGLLATFCDSDDDKRTLHHIQRVLFSIGGYLATDEHTHSIANPYEVKNEYINDIEQAIDMLSQQIPSLKCFILPGGIQSAAQAHVCRTVCRRVERRIVHFFHAIDYSMDHNNVLIYLNRLSDYFFVLAIKLNQDASVENIKL